VLFNNYCISVYAEDNGLVLTGYDTIYVTTDYGISWNIIYHSIGTQNYITDIKRVSKGPFYFSSYRTGLYEVDIITSVNDEENSLPKSYQLFQNYPNPFNPATRIQFSMSNKEFVSVKVYDVLGKEVATLVNEEKPAGNYEVEFDGSNLSSGVYMFTLIVNGFIQTKKMILLR
jgi:hypothetical protein